MRTIIVFDTPDSNIDADWRVHWGIAEACNAFQKVRYPVQIAVFDESGAQTFYFTRNT